MKKFSYILQTTGLKLAAALTRMLSERQARTFGRFLGRLGYRLAGFRRNVALQNLKMAFGEEMTEDKREQTVRQVFENIGQTATEVFRFPLIDQQHIRDIISCDNPELFEEVNRLGKGAILLSAHFGNWELLGGWVVAIGSSIDLIVKPQRNTSANEFYHNLRRSNGVGIIETQTSSRQIIRALKQNKIVAILADQFAGHDGVPVEFFGQLTATHRGPAAIALKLKCPIYHGVLVREADGRHRVLCGGPIEFEPSGNLDDDILALTRKFTLIFEDYIRQYPEQWLWTHRRWKDVRHY